MANKYSKGFYNLMSEAGISTSKIFAGYITNVLQFGESQDLNLRGFTFDDRMQIGFDFKQALFENRIRVMATYADKDSEVIPFGTKGFEVVTGVIPRQKARFHWDEDDYRKYLEAVQDLDFQNQSIEDYALDLLFNNLSDITEAHKTSMTYQRDQMVAKRRLVLDAKNNPRGIKGIVFESEVPEANVTTLSGDKRWFTDAEKTIEGANSDPVKDLKNKVRAIKRLGYTGGITVEVDEVSFFEDMNHSKWQIAIGYKLMPSLLQSTENDANAQKVGADAEDEAIVAAFKKIIGVKEVILNQGLVGVEKLGEDGELHRIPFRSFEASTYVFYPTGGPLGTIKVVAPLLPDDECLYGVVLGGKGIIQYEYDSKSKEQDWWSELTAICVPTRPKEMFYVEHSPVEESGSGSGSGSGNGGSI